MYTRIIRLMPLLVCLVGALPAHAGALPDRQLVQLPDLKALNLTASDMPAEPTHFALSTEWNDATTYASEYHRSAATLAREGFVAESLVDFHRHTHTGSGVVEVVSAVILTNGPTSARAEFSRSLKTFTHTSGKASAPLALSAAGDRSAAFKATTRDKSYSLPMTVEDLVFNRGAYVVLIELIGGSNTVLDRQLLTLARRVDARITAQIAHPTSVLARWNARAGDFGKGFQLISRSDTATGSTVVYRNFTGSGTETGSATIRSYLNAQAAQAVVRATISQLRGQGYTPLEMSEPNGQAGTFMVRTNTNGAGRKTSSAAVVFAEDGLAVVDQYTAPGDALSAFPVANGVGTAVDMRIILYRVR